jgi:hypothetical protein
MEGTGKQMAINWPLRWVESHVTAKRLIDDGMIGDLREVHFYDGNRGPLYHLADKVEVTPKKWNARSPELVVQKSLRRRFLARLSGLRRNARHVVHERASPTGGDLHGG